MRAAEPEQGARFAEAMLKSVTGGEPIVARAMFKDPFEFVPNWKLVISCNRKPQIRGDDRGIWRRTLVVPWPVSLPDEEMDRALKGKLAAERDGILNWLLTGWEDWLTHGLAPPQAVRQAVEEYRLQSNPFGVWFDSACEAAPGSVETAKRLYCSYRGFCTDLNMSAMTMQAFGRALAARQLLRGKSSSATWAGARLTEIGLDALRRQEATDFAGDYQLEERA